ncbi:hypothetical protein KSP39_PZI017964 [Platanthera zijinensis]|uniref:Integrase catalytic domain-containing protein n=1 Tax=Platanthera zijinensis TaxID=2320716 RepID=A0AAP0B674_9ASPA
MAERGHRDKRFKKAAVITFEGEDLEGVHHPHQDPLVISAGIGDPCHCVKRILIDGGSSVDILFLTTLRKLKLTNEQLSLQAGPVYDVSNIPVRLEGVIVQPVTLGVYPRQATHNKKRNFTPERQQAIEEEVTRLLRARFIRDVKYPLWVANVVMVKKANGSWRMCVDYSNLNQAFPKDSFPLPIIDQLVDATSGHELLSFMDAYSGYNQIKMNPTDEEHTTFRTDMGVYCYTVMPFGLKNAGATFQRLMHKVFKDMLGKIMEVYVDDMLVEGEYKAKNGQLAQYLALAKSLLTKIPSHQVIHIPREQNTRADALSKLATSSASYQSRRRRVEDVMTPNIQGPWEVSTIDGKVTSWMTPIREYLERGQLPDDRIEARRLRIRAAAFAIIDGELYKQAFSGPYLKCLPASEADYALREVHGGVCGEHLGGKALACKILRQGFYWPTMKKDAAELVQNCKSCQLHANMPHQLPVALTALQGARPFAQWGIDILDPLPVASGQRKFIIMAINYFTKWVEAEPLAKITEENTTQFVWKNIICRFGIPTIIIADNCTQFTGKSFTKLCEDLKINLRHIAVAHPQTNSQIEVTNRTILKGLKTRLKEAGGQWVDALPNVLWAYRTTERTPTGETPYNLCFGSEAVIPVDIGRPSTRVETFDADKNEDLLRENLDLLAEVRDTSALRMADYQRHVARFYDKRVKPRPISVRDLVLRSLEAAGKGPQQNKLTTAWEGPYVVTAVLKPGTFRIRNALGKTLPRTWNAQNLRRFYQ